ncbi:SDR family NAD(P)-dependent oxidoreductase [Tengunoibacter tsumagoiensis]|uniref:NAD(P)-dependent oxidoreductase n=1 Tax=Tengunoibacter tsumagoiensis TaxID=2014871 RepID=A0A401ZW74_9CHLR|nr:SDR family oxidoreductase [Tengunoibacter tsumagoiensis]GCE11052.1 NAD(P)-dependent oxidoreductase [Tengunoibacter tsumagoiensis]
MQESKGIEGKVVVLTGATGGIGRITAEMFARHGAKVVLVAQQVAALEMLETELTGFGADVMSVPADITDPTAIQQLQHEVQENYGSVDILINNAAIAIMKPVSEITSAEWNRMMDVNLFAGLRLIQAFLPGMQERHSGVIVNMAAAVGRNGYPNLAIYSATKAAVIAFSEALAKEVRRAGVQVYTICPHGVDTSLYHSLFGDADSNKLLKPEYVAQEILKVVMGQSSIRSGQTLELVLKLDEKGVTPQVK